MERDTRPDLHRSRRGHGALVGIVALFVALLTLSGLARRVLGSRVAGTAQGATVGQLAELAAGSAIEEALAALAADGDRDDVALARALGLSPGGKSAFTQAAPETVRRLAADPLTRDLALANKSVAISVRDAQAVGQTDSDRRAVLTLTAEVRHASTGVARRLSRDHAVRASRLAVPQPFDRSTVIVVDANQLHAADANATLKRTLDTMRQVRERVAPALERQVRGTLERINARMAEVSGQRSLQYTPYDVERYAAPFAAERHPAAPAFGESVTDAYHFFPQKLTIFTQAARLDDLGRADLKPGWARAGQRVAAARREHDTARSRFDAAFARLEEVSKARFSSVGEAKAQIAAMEAWLAATEELGRAMGTLGQGHEALIETHRAYTDAWRELAGQAREQVDGMAAALAIDAFRARAQHRFEGPDAVKQALAFLERYASASAPRLRAAVHVDNGATPLDLTALAGARIRGRLVLSATGPVAVRDLGVENATEDGVIVAAGGELSAAGEVTATLVAVGDLKAGADLALKGSVVMLAAPVAPLAGRVTARPAVELTRLAVAPWSTATTLERK